MPLTTTKVLVTLAMLASIINAKDSRTYAIVRHSGKPIVQARMDPIISPGTTSGHVHNVIGGTNFAMTMGTDTAMDATGTTAVVNADKSNYWFPEMYFHAPNGSFISVNPTQFNTYYFFEATDDTIKAFEPGLRMLVGNPFQRSPPYTSTSVLDAVNGQDKIQPIQWTCPRADESTPLYVANNAGRAVDPSNAGAGAGFPDRDCDAEGTGLRMDIHFPSCYNPAVDVANYTNNMQYPSSAGATGQKQNCPEGWIHTPHLFLEVYYDINHFAGEWTPGTGNVPWVLAMGDPYGFGAHADFISGWEVDTLQAMIDTCNAGFDGADKCPDLPGGVNTDQDVTIPDPIPEQAVGVLDKLPGCNPIQYGPGMASLVSGPDCAMTSIAGGSSSTSPATSSGTLASYTSSSSAVGLSTPTTLVSAVASSVGSSTPTTLVSAVASSLGSSSPTTLVSAVGGSSATTTDSAAAPSTTSESGSTTSGGGDECEPDEPTYVTTVVTSTTTVYATATSTTTATNITLPSGWKSFGCYSDLVPDRVLSGINLADLGGPITPFTCASYCDTQGFSMAGTEFGGQCFCGNELDSSSSALPASTCDMPCSMSEANQTSICGGSAALSVTKKSVSMRFKY